MTMARSKAALYLIFIVISLYSMSFMAQVPLLPYLLREMGSEDSASFGSMQIAFSLSQLLGGLVSGPCLDRWGAKTMLIVSLSSAAANYFFTASAKTLGVLFLSRVCAIMQHALLAARTFVAAAAPPEQRVRVLSLLSVFNSAGFALGPALGGELSQFGIRTTAWAATGASLLSVVAVMIVVPGATAAVSTVIHSATAAAKTADEMEGQTTDSDSEEAARSAAKIKGSPKPSWLQSLQVLKYPAVKQLMIINLAYNISTGLIQSIFALLLSRTYGLSSKNNGMVLSYQGALGMASQAFLVEPVRRMLGEGGSVVAGSASLVAAYLMLSVTSGSVPGLMVALLPSAAGAAILSTVLTAQLTRAAPQHVTGSVLALDMSLFAAVRMVTPAIGTALLDFGGAPALGCAAAGLMVLLLIAMQLNIVRSDGGLTPMAAKVVPVAGKDKYTPEGSPTSSAASVSGGLRMGDEDSGSMGSTGPGSVVIGILPHWAKFGQGAFRENMRGQLPLRAR